MSTASRIKGIRVYQQAHENEIEQSTLILMMYSGGIGFLDKALAAKDTDRRLADDQILKAKNVLLELMSSLNLDEGGDMGQLLFRTYRSLFVKLTSAHIAGDFARIAGVRDELKELESAWKEVFDGDEYRFFKQKKSREATAHGTYR